MKKSMLGLACVFVYLITVMSCEIIPQSVTIKGRPGLYIPIGSPFKDGERLQDYTSSANIRQMMGGGDDSIRIYDYNGNDVDAEVQAYIVHYPIAEIELEFIGGLPVNLPPNLTHTGIDYLLEGSYQITNSLRDFLGTEVTFKKAPGYIYVDGIGGASTMSLTFSNQEYIDEGLINDDSPLQSLSKEKRPEFPESEKTPFVKPVPAHSLTNQSDVDMTKILNAPSDSILQYKIKIPLTEIVESNKNKLVVDMVILLPLEFRVTTPSSKSGYVKLDLDNVFPQPASDSDMFGRTGDSDKDLLSNIESLTVTLKNPRNNIIDGIAILVKAKGKDSVLELNTDDQVVEYNTDDLYYPFSPQFEILLKKDNNADYATLKINRQDPDTAEFDFFLTVEAKASIEHTITF